MWKKFHIKPSPLSCLSERPRVSYLRPRGLETKTVSLYLESEWWSEVCHWWAENGCRTQEGCPESHGCSADGEEGTIFLV